jgi:hypothetical protein
MTLNDFLEFLGEFEAIFETASSRESGSYREDRLTKKKSHDTVPINSHAITSYLQKSW